jgi:hypothetical protein
MGMYGGKEPPRSAMDRNLIAVQSSERWRPIFQTENDDHFESESRRIKALSPARLAGLLSKPQCSRKATWSPVRHPPCLYS